MTEAFICDAVRTPIGRYAGALSPVRTDDLATLPIKALMRRNPDADWDAVDDVYFGCVNQAGEDNRNVARMALLLAGMSSEIPGATVNRLCASGMEAVNAAARSVRSNEGDLFVAGGVESMSRAPFVMAKATSAFDRNAQVFDTTIGWRFVNPEMERQYGTDAMPETAENVAEKFQIRREDQDAFALRSQQKAGKAMENGRLAKELEPQSIRTYAVCPGATYTALHGKVVGDKNAKSAMPPEKIAEKIIGVVTREISLPSGGSITVDDKSPCLTPRQVNKSRRPRLVVRSFKLISILFCRIKSLIR